MGRLDDDLDAILADQVANFDGVSVTYGAETTDAVLDDMTEEVLEAEGVGTLTQRRSVDIRTGTLTSLTLGAAITVGGTAYTIRNVGQPPEYLDGRVTRIWLKNA